MASELTTESYISHHLTNLTCGKTPDGWTCDPYKVDQMGFWAFHVDSLFWSIGLGALFVFVFRKAISKNSDASVAPSGLQNFVEMSIEFVEDNVQSLFGSVKKHFNRSFSTNCFCLDFTYEFNGSCASRFFTSACRTHCIRNSW